MALTNTQVSQLYVTLFGRASEGNGNTYWMTAQPDMTKTADVMLTTDAAKTYFGSTLADNKAFIEHIYLNALNKTYTQDKAGIDYWVAELDGGKSPGEVVTAMIDATQAPENVGSAQELFNNKVEVSNYTASKMAEFTDMDTFLGFLTGVTQYSTSVAIAKLNINKASITSAGVLSDGLIKGATIFADANGDGVWNIGEEKATTDSLGNFSLERAEGTLVATGGTDISTGLAFEGTFTAPAGSTVITPITSLIEKILRSGATSGETGDLLTPDEAAALVAKTLGISADINLLKFDPVAVAADATASAAEQAAAVLLQAVSVQVANMMGQAGAMLDGVGIASEESGAVFAAKALATMIIAASASETGKMDLTSPGTVEAFLQASAAAANATPEQIKAVETVCDDIATATANVNGAMADVVAKAKEGASVKDIFTGLAQIQVAAEAIEIMVESGAKKGDAASAASGSSGAAFNAAVANAADKVKAAEKVAAEEAKAGGTPTSNPDAGGGDTGGGDTGGGGTGGGGTVTPPTRALAFSTTTFAEADANDGSITATSTVTLTNDTFTGADGDVLGYGNNMPLGLTAKLVKTSATTATLSFSGNANDHTNAQDVSNLSVNFGKAAFAGGLLTTIEGMKTALSIDFRDPVTTFTVTNTSGDLTFGGTATGNITVSWVGTVNDSVASFTRDTHTVTADFTSTATERATSIVLAAGEVLSASAANLAGVTISGGTGIVTLTDTTLAASVLTTLDGTIAGTLNALSITSITDASVADATTLLITNQGTTGDKIDTAGSVAVTLATDTTATAAALVAIQGATTGFVDALSITSITDATVADATTLLITNQGTTGDKIDTAESVTVTLATDTTATAADLVAIQGATTGFVDALSITSITDATVVDAITLLITNQGTTGDKIDTAGSVAVTLVTDTTATAAALVAIQGATTGFVDALSITSITDASVADAITLLVTNQGTTGDKIDTAGSVAVTLNSDYASLSDIDFVLNGTTGVVTIGDNMQRNGTCLNFAAGDRIDTGLTFASGGVTDVIVSLSVNDLLEWTFGTTDHTLKYENVDGGGGSVPTTVVLTGITSVSESGGVFTLA